MRKYSRVGLAAILFIAACSSDGSSTSDTTVETCRAETTTAETDIATTTTEAVPGYTADITRTEFGIPHIVADDWGSLGFGQGYAYSQDRACTLLDQVIKVRGERAKWFGPGENDANIDSDFAYRHLHLWDDADERFGNQSERVSEMVTGYVAGFNAALADEGAHGWCAGEDWVLPITTTDLYANLNDITLFASSGNLIGPIATAQPPDTSAADTIDTTVAATTDTTSDTTTALGSNGWAIGSAGSETGGGMLIANPHFPWEGEKRLWESHLTLTTGELNVYGVGLTGVPGVLIGFNDAVAWTHTVSAGYRMTLYQLALTPGDPTSFTYGTAAEMAAGTAATEQMIAEDIDVNVLQTDGTYDTRTRTMYASHYGPMLNLPLGWTDTTAYTMRDANIDNTDILEQFFGMGTATSMDEFIDAHRTANGIPWVNTIATSADGRAWYADTAATPNLSAEAITAWQTEVFVGGLAKTVLDNGAILLNGSDSMNEWVDDPTATRPGILPFEQQPQLERDDYVFNANDSHWLANPAQLLTGYSPLTGPEGVAQPSRTRENAFLLADPSLRGDDGTFDLNELAAWFSNRGLHADLLRDQVVTACDEQQVVLVEGLPFDITPACDTLRNWDGRLNNESKGAVLWREFLGGFTQQDRTNAGDLYSVPFDPADPVGTPNTIAEKTVTISNNLAAAMMALESQGWAIDIALGDVQYDGRAIDERISIPGGTNLEGAISIVDCCSGANTPAPRGDPGNNIDGRYFTSNGYPVTFGNSFVMAMEFGPDGPSARAILTYGQPDDPADPNFTAQTKVYSGMSLRDVLFTPDEVQAGAVGDTVTVSGERR
ncbi:MAG: penicillin acylase family protein [Ilumatobacteraceae bacterium]|nr:penicillin acylase family protein [Ilumatobacteraceae bacterium]